MQQPNINTKCAEFSNDMACGVRQISFEKHTTLNHSSNNQGARPPRTRRSDIKGAFEHEWNSSKAGAIRPGRAIFKSFLDKN